MDKVVFSIALCDDAPQDLQRLEQAVRAVLTARDIPFRLQAFTRADALLDSLRDQPQQFQLLLLDILMAGLDGMALAQTLRRENVRTAIVFVTSSAELALQGYEVEAARYLTKPLDPEKLEEALVYCYGQVNRKKEILVQAGAGYHRIAVEDIQYIEVEGRGTAFVTGSGTVHTRMKISELEGDAVLAGFVRCHQSFLVNLSHLVSVRRYTAALRSGAEVPISKQRYDATRLRLLDYLQSGQ